MKDQLEALVLQMYKSNILYSEGVREFKKRFILTVLQENKGNQVPRRARTGHAPQYSQPYYLRVEDRRSSAPRWRQASPAQCAPYGHGKESGSLNDSVLTPGTLDPKKLQGKTKGSPLAGCLFHSLAAFPCHCAAGLRRTGGFFLGAAAGAFLVRSTPLSIDIRNGTLV